MPCETVRLPGGGVAIVCSRGRQKVRMCEVCSERQATLLCDYPVGHGKTCDKAMCESCTTRPQQVLPLETVGSIIGETFDYCPEHGKF